MEEEEGEREERKERKRERETRRRRRPEEAQEALTRRPRRPGRRRPRRPRRPNNEEAQEARGGHQAPENAKQSQIRESFGPVQRNAMPTAPARAPALISKVGHLGGGWGLGRGWGHELERLQLVKESLRLQWAPKTHTARFQ